MICKTESALTCCIATREG